MPRKPPKPETITAYEEYDKRIKQLQEKYHMDPVKHYDRYEFKRAYEGQKDSMNEIVLKSFTGTPYTWDKKKQIEPMKKYMIAHGIYKGEDDEGIRIRGAAILRNLYTQHKMEKYKFMYDARVINWIGVEVFGSEAKYAGEDNDEDSEE